jgi:hypothetical protein
VGKNIAKLYNIHQAIRLTVNEKEGNQKEKRKKMVIL